MAEEERKAGVKAEPGAESEAQKAEPAGYKGVLVVAAHPDDPEFGFGASVAQLAAAGAQVTYVICTDGSQGGEDPSVPDEELIAIRQREQREAARILGVASLGLVFIVAAFASTSAVLSAIARSEIDPRLYRFAMLPGLFTTVLMVAMLLGVVAWFFGLWLASPSAYLSGNDGVLATNTALNSLVPVLLMLAAIAVAGRATLRGMRGSTPQQAA